MDLYMPELPEVEVICQALKARVLNKVILKPLRLTDFDLRQPISKNIVEKLTNAKIIEIARRAKYIQIFLDNASILLIHLGMSGKLLIKERDYIYQKHDHLALQLEDGQQLVYNDPRRFGLISLIANDQQSPLFKNLGIEPLTPEFTTQYLAKLLEKKKQPIKLFLMDNINIVGVGNIYASESLFLSGILPNKMALSLSELEVNLLHNKIIEVLEAAIKQGGSSLKDYASIGGEKGYFQHLFKVYGREGKHCFVCNSIIAKIKQGGRASFYCPTCQK